MSGRIEEDGKLAGALDNSKPELDRKISSGESGCSRELVNVALPLPNFEPFTYSIPEALRGRLREGDRVVVPFMKGMKTGVVVGFPDTTELERVREVIDLADDNPPLNRSTMDLCRWIADYYVCPLGEVLAAAHPAGMLAESKKIVRLKDDFGEGLIGLNGYSLQIRSLLERLKKSRAVSLNTLRKESQSGSVVYLLKDMERRGIVEIVDRFPDAKYKPKWIAYLSLNPDLSEDYIDTWLNNIEGRAPKQAVVVRYLRNELPVTRKALLTATGVSSSVVKSLVDKGILREKYREVIRDTAVRFDEDFKITHTAQQRKVISAINKVLSAGGFVPFLLYGVTGSGKTEVYMETISYCLQQGKSAMVLVPEIALTPQIASRFRHRFGAQVVILHSRISQGERYDSWRRLAYGRARVVIGARSALFAPLDDLGLVVVDEEHEHSFKQINRPHYNARDCAVWLAKKLNIPVVLGSATPSMESYYNAQRGKYRLLELPDRVAGGKFSTLHLVDLTEENAVIGNTSISPLLMEKIEDRLEHGDKTIILQNRRGFSTFIKCKMCGAVEECPNCSITLTYHITNRRLRCHICGYQRFAPRECSSCGGAELLYCGTGTQKVADEFSMLFPDARIVRMDLDTTSGVDSHFKILEAFAQGKYDILLGTQMVAKGLDFPEVTLVGIISADTELLRPDFRAEERTFRLLLQAAGRSGRHRPGEVVVQTFNPHHPIFNLVKNNDYIGFYQKTIRERRGLRYPPFGRLIKINVSGGVETKTAEAAAFMADCIPRDGIKILGPSPALIVKIKRRYYYHILIKTGNYSFNKLAAIKSSLLEARNKTIHKYRRDKISVEIDVDPVDMH